MPTVTLPTLPSQHMTTRHRPWCRSIFQLLWRADHVGQLQLPDLVNQHLARQRRWVNADNGSRRAAHATMRGWLVQHVGAFMPSNSTLSTWFLRSMQVPAALQTSVPPWALDGIFLAWIARDNVHRLPPPRARAVSGMV